MSKGCPCLVCHESYLIISTGMKDPSLQPVLDIIPHDPLSGRPSLDHDSLGVHHYNERDGIFPVYGNQRILVFIIREYDTKCGIKTPAWNYNRQAGMSM
jgi:hypothetical protein